MTHLMNSRALAAVTTAALAAGLLVTAPASTAATRCEAVGPGCEQPRLISVTTSKKVVVTKRQEFATRNGATRLTAVFHDPDDVLFSAGFATDAYAHRGVLETAYVAKKSGARRTFVVTMDERSDVGKPGKRTVWVHGQLRYGVKLPGVTGTTSYTVRHKPKVIMHPLGSMSTISGEKARFWGRLAYTTARANKKLTLAFKRNGTKKFVRRQVLRTDKNGDFRTKRFKNKVPGVWRMSHAGKGPVLKANPAKLKAKRYF